MHKGKGFIPLEIKIPNRENRKFLTGFTLIELLMVISIVVLLMALLLPALQRVRRQARAMACQSNLHQWAVAFSMYIDDNGGAMPLHFRTGAGSLVWPYELRSYYSDSNDLLLCPAAIRSRIRPDNPFSTSGSGSTLKIAGGKSAAWEYKFDLGPRKKANFSGSYGINGWVTLFHMNDPNTRRDLNSIPVLLDCAYQDAWPWPFDRPPEYEGQIDRPGDIKYFCINRHDGFVNGLFLDWSVRRIGLKELWTLRWDPQYGAQIQASSPWSKAGGVQPSDWPPWMRRFKDY